MIRVVMTATLCEIIPAFQPAYLAVFKGYVPLRTLVLVKQVTSKEVTISIGRKMRNIFLMASEGQG